MFVGAVLSVDPAGIGVLHWSAGAAAARAVDDAASMAARVQAEDGGGVEVSEIPPPTHAPVPTTASSHAVNNVALNIASTAMSAIVYACPRPADATTLSRQQVAGSSVPLAPFMLAVPVRLMPTLFRFSLP